MVPAIAALSGCKQATAQSGGRERERDNIETLSFLFLCFVSWHSCRASVVELVALAPLDAELVATAPLVASSFVSNARMLLESRAHILLASSASILLGSSGSILLVSSAPILLGSSARILLHSSAPTLLGSSARILLDTSACILLASRAPILPRAASCLQRRHVSASLRGALASAGAVSRLLHFGCCFVSFALACAHICPWSPPCARRRCFTACCPLRCHCGLVSGGMHIHKIFDLLLRWHSGTLFLAPCTFLKFSNSFFGGVVELCFFKVSLVFGDLSGGPWTTRLLWASCLSLYLHRSP